MKNLYLLFPVSLMVGALAACSADTQTVKEGSAEEAEQAVLLEDSNEASDEIQNENWRFSPSFDHSIVDKDGKEISYIIVGNKETLGFAGEIGLKAEKSHKLLWFYFGEENIFDKPVEVNGIRKGTEEMVNLHSGTFYQGAEAGPGSVNMPSSLKFPSAGKWKILIYIDGEFYESIAVEVD